MKTNGKTSIKESKMKMTTSTLMRLAGVSAVLAGLCFIIIGMFHPENVTSSVTTTTWVNVHIAATALGFFGLFGLAGLYARQVEKSGWLGLTGFLLFSIWFVLVSGFSFVEAFILPQLAAESPAFVESLLGMFTNTPTTIDLGVLPTLWNVSGPMYILGALLFGIATFRAQVLPRWAAGLLTLGAMLIPIGGMVPHEYQAKIAMIPIGLAMAWLGSALIFERRMKASESLISQRISTPEASKVA
ncbi:MAG TPA: hypothetical protein PKC52_16380 [Anaerolineales bacterium]|nr:hypothetical protein [Anaerolineales bacterium]HNA55742.1 hypothetical protein [Anaerolineales bacterium]